MENNHRMHHTCRSPRNHRGRDRQRYRVVMGTVVPSPAATARIGHPVATPHTGASRGAASARRSPDGMDGGQMRHTRSCSDQGRRGRSYAGRPTVARYSRKRQWVATGMRAAEMGRVARDHTSPPLDRDDPARPAVPACGPSCARTMSPWRGLRGWRQWYPPAARAYHQTAFLSRVTHGLSTFHGREGIVRWGRRVRHRRGEATVHAPRIRAVYPVGASPTCVRRG